MELSAEAVSLYFPVVGRRKLDPAVQSRLGGVLTTLRGKPCVRALDDVTLRLRDGDHLGVVGHNGSGKSTLLRTLAGIYVPHRGTVTASTTVSGIFNMSIGFRHEASGYRNIVLKGLMAGKSRREIDAVVPAIAELTELGPYLDMPLSTYSQGMAMRLAFAITTTFAHDILVMDEWIGAGDAQFQERVIARMNTVLEATHIYVVASHNKGLLQRLTKRCIWMEDGRVRADGPTQEIVAMYDEEARKLQMALEAANAPLKLPIPEDHEVLQVRAPQRPGSRAVELHWDLERFHVQRVELVVHDPRRDGDQIVCSGSSRGSRRTGEWVRPGLVFRLRDPLDGAELGAVTIMDRHFDRKPDEA